MFAGASSFNQPLDNWNISNVTNMSNMLTGATSFSSANLDRIYKTWSTLTVQTNVSFGAAPCYNPSAAAGRAVLTGTYGWNITDGGLCSPAYVFITRYSNGVEQLPENTCGSTSRLENVVLDGTNLATSTTITATDMSTKLTAGDYFVKESSTGQVKKLTYSGTGDSATLFGDTATTTCTKYSYSMYAGAVSIPSLVCNKTISIGTLTSYSSPLVVGSIVYDINNSPYNSSGNTLGLGDSGTPVFTSSNSQGILTSIIYTCP